MSAKPHWKILLEVLSDGRQHTHHELYALGMIVHSRVSFLRKRGYTIEAWREIHDGRPVYLYKLVPQERLFEVAA